MHKKSQINASIETLIYKQYLYKEFPSNLVMSKNTKQETKSIAHISFK